MLGSNIPSFFVLFFWADGGGVGEGGILGL